MPLSGVQILLTKRTRIPLWIKVQDENVKSRTVHIGAGSVFLLKIRGGSAKFISGNRIGLKMPGSSRYLGAFENHVLEIRTFNGKLRERNHYCCKNCTRMTGEVKVSHEGTEIGKRNLTIACEPCKRFWTLENV